MSSFLLLILKRCRAKSYSAFTLLSWHLIIQLHKNVLFYTPPISFTFSLCSTNTREEVAYWSQNASSFFTSSLNRRCTLCSQRVSSK